MRRKAKSKAEIAAKVKHVQTCIALGQWDKTTEDVRWSLTTLACTQGWPWEDRVAVFVQVNAARGVYKTFDESNELMMMRINKWGNEGAWTPK